MNGDDKRDGHGRVGDAEGPGAHPAPGWSLIAAAHRLGLQNGCAPWLRVCGGDRSGHARPRRCDVVTTVRCWNSGGNWGVG